MKKMLVAMSALALVAQAVSAADVYSSNIVGYTKIDLFANTFSMVGSTLINVGGTTDVFIADFFEDNSQFISGDNELAADTIKVWNGAGYDTYFFSSDCDPAAWASDQDSFTETTDTIPMGGSFWFIRRGAALTGLAVAGEVQESNVTVAAYANTFSMVGNPFGASLAIKTVSAPDLLAGDNELAADTIKVWNGAGYDTYFFSSDCDPAAWASDQDSFTETEDSIPMGGAFWFIRRGAATTLTLPVPY